MWVEFQWLAQGCNGFLFDGCVQRNHCRRETYHEAWADIAEWKQHCNCESIVSSSFKNISSCYGHVLMWQQGGYEAYQLVSCQMTGWNVDFEQVHYKASYWIKDCRGAQLEVTFVSVCSLFLEVDQSSRFRANFHALSDHCVLSLKAERALSPTGMLLPEDRGRLS